MVHGDRRPHVVALVVPDEVFVQRWARDHGRANDHSGAIIDDAAFRETISDAVDRVNDGLSVIEKVRRFMMTAEAFTIENGMMTPTLKIRRHVIRDKYGNALEALYGG